MSGLSELDYNNIPLLRTQLLTDCCVICSIVLFTYAREREAISNDVHTYIYVYLTLSLVSLGKAVRRIIPILYILCGLP